jgi:hypothetical protein
MTSEGVLAGGFLAASGRTGQFRVASKPLNPPTQCNFPRKMTLKLISRALAHGHLTRLSISACRLHVTGLKLSIQLRNRFSFGTRLGMSFERHSLNGNCRWGAVGKHNLDQSCILGNGTRGRIMPHNYDR